MSAPSLHTVPELSASALWDLLADSSVGVLATIRSDGRPQLSNIGYRYDPATRTARIIAATFRAKARNLARDPRASLHVSNDGFSLWLVADGTVELSEPARDLSDPVGQELLGMYGALSPDIDQDALAAHLEDYPILDRLIIRLHVDRIYGGNSSAALGISDS